MHDIPSVAVNPTFSTHAISAYAFPQEHLLSNSPICHSISLPHRCPQSPSLLAGLLQVAVDLHNFWNPGAARSNMCIDQSTIIYPLFPPAEVRGIQPKASILSSPVSISFHVSLEPFLISLCKLATLLPTA